MAPTWSKPCADFEEVMRVVAVLSAPSPDGFVPLDAIYREMGATDDRKERSLVLRAIYRLVALRRLEPMHLSVDAVVRFGNDSTPDGSGLVAVRWLPPLA